MSTRNVRQLRTGYASCLAALTCVLVASSVALPLAASALSDGEITSKLRAAYRTVEGFEKVNVSVKSGVVALDGLVLSESYRMQAEALAEEVDGVTLVANDLTVERDVRARLAPIAERLRQTLFDFVAFAPLILVAVVVIAFAWLLARLLSSWEAFYRKLAGNALLGELLQRMVRIGILALGVLLALEILDATALVGAMLGTAGVVGLAVGFAFRDIMENYVAGVLLSVRQPFGPLDLVRIGDSEGKVMRLTSRATILMTVEGNHLRIPNATVFKSDILNYTRNPQRRFDFGVGVGMQENLVAVRELGEKILNDMDGVLDDPAPFSRIEPLGDFSVTVRHFGWVDQIQHDFSKVRSEAIRLVKRGFDEAEIDMPEPIQKVRIESVNPPHGTVSKQSVSDESSTTQDVSRESSLDLQIEAERAETGESDLLDHTAPQE